MRRIWKGQKESLQIPFQQRAVYSPKTAGKHFVPQQPIGTVRPAPIRRCLRLRSKGICHVDICSHWRPHSLAFQLRYLQGAAEPEGTSLWDQGPQKNASSFAPEPRLVKPAAVRASDRLTDDPRPLLSHCYRPIRTVKAPLHSYTPSAKCMRQRRRTCLS